MPDPSDPHHMYKHPPVVFVTAETKFPGNIGEPVPSPVQHAIGGVLGEDWVVDQVQPGITVNLGMPFSGALGGAAIGGGAFGGASLGPTNLGGAMVRFANRDRTMSVALTAGTLSVETTRYANWDDFRAVLSVALEATEKLMRPTGVTRTGLRYIDEIRVGAVIGNDWSEWLSPASLPPSAGLMAAAGWPPETWTGLAHYQIGPDRHMVLRYGPQPAQPGFLVNPNGPLKRPGPLPPGAFFGLDFDAFWEPTGIPIWKTEDLLQTYDQLRVPVRSLFDSMITERLIAEVFEAEGE